MRFILNALLTLSFLFIFNDLSFSQNCNLLSNYSDTLCHNISSYQIAVINYNLLMYDSNSDTVKDDYWTNENGDTVIEVSIDTTSTFYYIAVNTSDDCRDTATLTINIGFLDGENSTISIVEDQIGSSLIILGSLNKQISNCNTCNFTWFYNVNRDSTILDSTRFSGQLEVFCLIENTYCSNFIDVDLITVPKNGSPAWTFSTRYLCSNDVHDLKPYIKGDVGGIFSVNGETIENGVISNWNRGSYSVRYTVGNSYHDQTIIINGTTMEFEKDTARICLGDTIDLLNKFGLSDYSTHSFNTSDQHFLDDTLYIGNYLNDTVITIESYLENTCAQDSFTFYLNIDNYDFNSLEDTKTFCSTNDSIDLISLYSLGSMIYNNFESQETFLHRGRYLDLSTFSKNELFTIEITVNDGCKTSITNPLFKLLTNELEKSIDSTLLCREDSLFIESTFELEGFNLRAVNLSDNHYFDSIFINTSDSNYNVTIKTEVSNQCAQDTIGLFVDFIYNDFSNHYDTTTFCNTKDSINLASRFEIENLPTNEFNPLNGDDFVINQKYLDLNALKSDTIFRIEINVNDGCTSSRINSPFRVLLTKLNDIDTTVLCLGDSIDLIQFHDLSNYSFSAIDSNQGYFINGGYLSNQTNDTVITVQSIATGTCMNDTIKFNINHLNLTFEYEIDTIYYCASLDTIDLVKDFGFEHLVSSVFYSNDPWMKDHRYLDLGAVDTNLVFDVIIQVNDGCASENFDNPFKMIDENFELDKETMKTNNCFSRVIDLVDFFELDQFNNPIILHSSPMITSNQYLIVDSSIYFDSLITLDIQVEGHCSFDTVQISFIISNCFTSSEMIHTDGISNTSSNWDVYPNPSNGTLYIPIKGSVSVYNLAGKLMLTELQSEAGLININDLDEGFYFIQVRNKDQFIISRFLKF